MKYPPSSIDASATAAIGTGRTGMRGVATGSSPIAAPWRRAIAAATCRWQFRPWHIPIVTRVSALIAFRSVEVGDRAVEVCGRQLLASADDRLVGVASS